MKLLAADILTVVSAAEAGSFAKAARRLGAEQSTISRRVRTIEEALGVILFDRWSGGARLTEAGRILVEEASRCGRALEAAVAQARAATASTPFRLGFAWSFSCGEAARRLAALRASRPSLRPRLREAGCAELVSLVLAHELDCAWVAEPHELDRRLAASPLWWERLWLAATGLAGTPSWRDLDGRTLLCRAGADAAELGADLAALGEARVRLEAHDCSLETLKRMAAAGDGVLVLPESLADDLPEGLDAAPFPDSQARRRVVAVYRSDDRNPVLADAAVTGARPSGQTVLEATSQGASARGPPLPPRPSAAKRSAVGR
ncbi:MAG: LysR family transcriptional regulator [Alphaproteobacteria bacterium]|nr:LysR family transcriptional regulator [Alphaproteobacteria bacterium]